MKKSALLLVLAATIMFSCKNDQKKEITSEENMDAMVSDVIDEHNSENSLDWAGVYEGTVPCADCEGIKTVLALNEDTTFTLSETYLGKPGEVTKIEKIGNFSWDDSGSEITLKEEGNQRRFKVGENQLMMLDQEGNMIDGQMSDLYILIKKVE